MLQEFSYFQVRHEGIKIQQIFCDFSKYKSTALRDFLKEWAKCFRFLTYFFKYSVM
jgi:hypothetical protein